MALLHSFWFPEALKAFQAAAQADPACGIAHWGAAVAWLGNPLGGPPTARGLEEGTAAVGRAKAAGAKSPRERDWIEAIAVFYQDHDKVDHRSRAVGYEKAMESLSGRYPQDREAAIFYALALNITLNPADKTYANQLKAAAILETVFAEQPEHPGVAHYLIHSYDFPPIASKGVTAARRYAGIAPSAPHALHMPSHIFTRARLLAGVDRHQPALGRGGQGRAAPGQARGGLLQCPARHGLHRSTPRCSSAGTARPARCSTRSKAIDKIDVEQFAAAFAFAAIPARYALERRDWARRRRAGISPGQHVVAEVPAGGVHHLVRARAWAPPVAAMSRAPSATSPGSRRCATA